MLVTLTALAVITLFDPPAGKEPPTKDELAAITDRGRDLAGHDAAAWHASDALQAKRPKEGSVARYIELEPPKNQDNQQVAGIHTHVLFETPEDTDVFHVLTRKPSVPEFISTQYFMFVVDVDGSIMFQGNAAVVQKKR